MWRKRLSGRKYIIILVSLVLASFALMTFDIRRSQAPNFFETTLMWLVSPVQNLITHSMDAIGNVV
ncbi:MAG: rod shape-determining protein MreC, partial [Nitrospinae bacterium]|nr:rod shape-determining protein MreC [Nitrospinota bacterium]